MSQKGKNSSLEELKRAIEQEEERETVPAPREVAPRAMPSSSSTTSQVVVASLQPPMLESCTSVIQLIIFHEKYSYYVQRGGRFGLGNCLEMLVAARLARSFTEALTEVDEKRLLLKLFEMYAPRSVVELNILLKSLKCNLKGSQLDVDGILTFTTRFISIVTICSVKLPKEQVVRIFINAIGDEDFKNYLMLHDLKAEDFDKWVDIVVEKAEIFRSIQVHSSMVSSSSSKKSLNRPVAALSPAPVASAAPVVSTQSQARRPVAMVAAAAAANGGGKKTWDRHVCLGCGIVTNPPHRRKECPHRSVPGWMAKAGFDTMKLPPIFPTNDLEINE